ncbi:MAG TPA: RidA family protein [Acidimicrobiales bacterium]|nr:RidA family protein [Acidimicrobiales bacterium]
MDRGRRTISSGSPWEAVVGYSRAVRVGDHVVVAGTAPQNPDGTVDPDVEAQAHRCLTIIRDALVEAGAALADVVRTRVYLVDAGDFDAVARAHRAAFGDVRPANTTVVVAGLLDERWRVEIEADAILRPDRPR